MAQKWRYLTVVVNPDTNVIKDVKPEQVGGVQEFINILDAHGHLRVEQSRT